MNDYEISKLKKELLRKQELLKEQREDRQKTYNKLIEVQADRDRFHGELVIARQTIENVDQIIAHNVKEMRNKLQQQNSESFAQLQRLKDKLQEEKRLNQKLSEENSKKQTVISQLSLRLREMSRKYKDPSMLVNTKDLSEQAIITHNQLYKLTDKYDKLCADMENVMAQNKILRKLHGVPDNFGFDLQEIKIAEKQQLEDYKAQCRKLETEIEELEAERTQLRYRLRQYNTLYSNKGERYKDMTQQQFQLLDQYALNLKQGKVQLPQIDKSQKEMEKQILKLRAQLQVLQAQGKVPISMMPKDKQGEDKVSMQTLRKFQDQVKSVLEPFVQDMKKMTENNKINVINNVQNTQYEFNTNNQIQQGNSQIQPGGNFRPPIPLPIANNDWSQIKEGYSYTYSSKIPLNMKDMNDQIGFNVMKAKYEVAALQLQNIESLKLLKEKQIVESKLIFELQDLKDKYVKCLRVQDDLFIKYFKQKDQVNDRIKKLQIQKSVLSNEKEQVEAKHAILADAYGVLSRKTDRSELESKCTDYASRLAISEAQIIKLQRKYNVISEEQKMLRDAYTNLQTKSLEGEYALKEKLAYAKKNQKQLTGLMNQVLSNTKQSVAGDVHNALLARMQAVNDKATNSAFKETELRLRIDKLESIEREINNKDEIIQSLREGNLDINLQLQIVRSRLESVDADYKAYRMTFDRLVKFVNQNNISLVSYFKKFDRNGSGELDKTQFMSALSTLGFQVTNNELQLLFNEFDLDGSQHITYKEFLRKLRRSGVLTRSKEQDALFRIFKAMKQAKISVRKAFQIIDMDGSNEISKSELEKAFRTIGIQISAQTVDYIFKSCDSDMSGTISCNQFQKLFEEVVRQSLIQDQQVYNEELDWKLAFVIKIQECSLKYHNSLQQTFKVLDKDGNACLTINELKEFLNKSGVQIPSKSLLELFDYLDKVKDGQIQYGQFLKILEEAKREKKRIDRIKFIKTRTEQLRKENEVSIVKQGGERYKIGEEAGMKVRMMALETKQQNLMKKNQKLVKTVVNKQQQISDLQRQIQEKDKENVKIKDQYYKQKEATVVLQQKMKHSIGQQQARKIQNQNNQYKIRNLELNTQCELYKSLFQGLSDKNKGDELRVGKIESERNKYYDIVKDLQGMSDLNAEIGKKAIQIQYSKRNQEIVNKKYDKVIEEIRKMTEENKKMLDQNMEKERQIVNAHIFMQQKSNLQQRNIDNLTAKILPTVNASRIEQILIKIRQISNSKSALERQNKDLRQANFNIQLRNDYIQNQRIHIEQLQKKLKRTYTDESSVTIIELTKKLSEYKMNELKAKRECGLLKEKEEYYMRVNNSINQNIKELEEELGKWEIKYNEREEFWRKRISDQMKLMQDLQRQASKIKEEQRNAQNFFKGQRQEERAIQQKFDSLPEAKQSQISSFVKPRSSISNNQNTIELKNRIRQLQEELLAKEKEIYQLKTAFKEIVPEAKFHEFGSQMGASTNSFVMQTDLTSSQLKNNARRFINSQKEQENFYKEEATRLTQAAQHSIDTLQRIIDDKNEQLKRKDKIIEDLKRDFIKNKEEDCRQIQRLHQEIRSLNTSGKLNSLNEIMTKSTNKNFYPGKGDQKVQGLMQIIDQKEEEIKHLQEKYDKLYISKEKKNGETNAVSSKMVERKIADLQEQRQAQKKKFQESEEQLKKKIKNLENLSKQKDAKLAKLQKTLIDLKNFAVNEKHHLADPELQENMNEMINNMNRAHNPNDSKMEAMMQKSLQTIQELTKKNRQYEGELKRIKEEKLGKTMSKR